MQQAHHVIETVEFAVRDLVRAKRFYAGAFGWASTDYGPAYAGIQSPDGEICGLAESDDVWAGGPQTGGPLVILFSDDPEASRRAVESAGGVVSKAPFAFPGGRRFHFRDPSSNELAVWARDDP